MSGQNKEPVLPVVRLSLWGIWIRGQGWWKVPAPGIAGLVGKKRAFVDVDKDTVDKYAHWVGGQRMPIDDSLERGEADLLKHENEKGIK